jgi:hypothetical protein
MDIENAVVVLDGKQWEKELPDLGDLEVLVAPWDNAAYERALGKKIRKLPPGLRPDGAVEPQAFYRVMGEAMAETILLDWRNFKAGGKDKPYDKDYARTLLTDPKYRPFRDGVVVAAKRVQLGGRDLEEALMGNSGASSSGGKNGEATKTA